MVRKAEAFFNTPKGSSTESSQNAILPQPVSSLFITRTSHLNHTRPQNAPHATHKFRVPLLNARTQPSFDQTDDGVDAETSLSFSLFMSISLLRLYTFFSRSQSVIIFSLKMRVSSKELFSTLKNQDKMIKSCPLLFCSSHRKNESN